MMPEFGRSADGGRRQLAGLPGGCTVLGKKIFLAAFLTLIVILSWSGGFASADREARETVVAGALRNWPPHYQADPETGEASGFAVEVLDAVAARAGLDISYTLYESWPQLQEALLNGEVDLIPNIGITEQRRQHYDFTVPVETFTIVLFVRSTNLDIAAIDDCRGRRVAVVEKNQGLVLMQERGDSELVVYRSLEEAFLALLSGNVEALVYPRPPVEKLALQAGLGSALKVVGEPLLEVKRGIAVRQGSHRRLLARLDEAAAAYILTPAYMETYRSWYSTVPPPFWNARRVAALVSVVLAAAVSVMLLWRNFSLSRLNRRLRRAVAEQQQSEQKFQRLFESSPYLMSISSLEDGRYLEVNEMFARTTGYRREQVIGRRSVELGFITPSERARIAAGFEQHGRIRDMELTVRHADGSELICLYAAELVEMDGERLILSSGADITERKRMEQTLARSERKWRNVLENTPQIGISLDPEARIVFANRAFLEVTGWQLQEVLDRNWFDLCIPAGVREQVREVFATVMGRQSTDGLTSYENEILTKNGELRYISWSNVLTLGPDGRIQDVTCLGVDLTERARAEEALLERERKYYSLFEESNDGIFLHGSDGRILEVNDQAAAMLGYRREELLGRTLDSLHRPEELEAARHLLGQHVEQGSIRFESVLLKRDGSPVEVEVSGRLVDERTGLYQGIVRDITERKALEEQFRQAQKMESVGRLAGGVAHDLNNLLAPIIGYAEMLLEDLGRTDPRREAAEQIVFAGERAAELVRQLLAFGRKQALERRVLDLNRVLERFEPLLRRTLREDIELRFELDPELPPVMADISQLEQVLMNLAVNAQDAMPGGGRLTLSTCRGGSMPADREDGEGGDFVLLRCRDTGCGMDEATRDHIFEPFFTTKGKFEGTGLGLSTVYGIVKQHDGSIRVESAPGAGTTFEIRLPVHAAAA